jgi:hypothetical protein
LGRAALLAVLALLASRKQAGLGLLMTNYYPMIARCVADLKENIAARHEFYWLARAELAVQLCGLDPPLTQSEMMCEHLALDEAISKVDAECLPSVEVQCLNPAQALEEDLQRGSGVLVSVPNLRIQPPDMRAQVSMHGREMLEFVNIRLTPGMSLVKQGRHSSDTITCELASTLTRPLIAKFAGVLLVIALALTLYWQGQRFTTLFVKNHATQVHETVKSSSKMNYYVGQLGELASTAARQTRSSRGPDRLILPTN